MPTVFAPALPSDFSEAESPRVSSSPFMLKLPPDQMPRAISGNYRVEVVDGLRGVAVLLVVAYHYFSRWPDLYPFGKAFVDVEPAASGFVGVYLFFIVSGFVIARSLSSSRTFLDFAAKRMDRLVLPMVVLSSISFFLLSGPLQTSGLEQRWANFLPSWTFSPPAIWKFVDPEIDYIDGVYWTLFVEVRFYFVIALIWFLGPQKHALTIFAGCAALAPAVYWALLGTDGPATAFNLMFFPSYAALFAAGALYYKVFAVSAGRVDIALLVLLIPVSSAAPLLDSAPDKVAPTLVWCALFHAVFLSLAFRLRWVVIFSGRSLVWIGLVSYSLYLLHQNIGVALIARIPSSLPPAWQLVAVAMVTGVLTAVAACSWFLIERRRLFSGCLKLAHR